MRPNAAMARVFGDDVHRHGFHAVFLQYLHMRQVANELNVPTRRTPDFMCMYVTHTHTQTYTHFIENMPVSYTSRQLQVYTSHLSTFKAITTPLPQTMVVPTAQPRPQPEGQTQATTSRTRPRASDVWRVPSTMSSFLLRSLQRGVRYLPPYATA